MASDTANVKLGVCKITFGGVDLGYTKGGVEVEVTTDTHQVTVDQFGESVINEYITKRDIKVKAPLAETTLENLVNIMPGAALITGGGASPSAKRVDITNGVEQSSLLSSAQELKLHPIELPDNDESEDLVIPKAATPGAMNFSYKHNDERIYNTEFMGYPDSATGILFKLGDSAAAAV